MTGPRVALVFVPQGEPTMPHIALPLLKAYLQARLGATADLFDLNLAFYRQLLSGDAEASSLALLDGREWDPSGYRRALRVTARTCALFAHRHPAYRLSLKNLSMPAWDRSSAGLMQAILDANNPFVPFFAPHVARLATYDVIGLSLAWAGQLVPLFTLARQLRKAAPAATIVLGGSLVPHLLESLLSAPALLEAIDYLVPHEGERPLAAIVSAAAEGRPTGTLRGAFVLPGRGREPRAPAGLSWPLPAGEIPTPDFSGLPLCDYLSPVVTLPVMATRGCHHGTCAYCDHAHHVSAPLQRPVERIAGDIETYRTRHGARHVAFADDSLPAAVLDGLSRRLADRPAGDGQGIRFIASTRLEAALSGDVIERAAAAGCHALLFGLESGSQRTLDRMGKGIDLAEAGRVLTTTHDVGIITWCFFIVGYPGETPEEVAATFDYLRRGRPVIDVIAGGPFVLTRRSPLVWGRKPAALAVDRQIPDLALRYDSWQHPGTMPAGALAAALASAGEQFRGLYASLPVFVEAHTLALCQDDYQRRFVAGAGDR